MKYKKNLKLTLLVAIILFGTAISLAFILPYFKEQSSQTQTKKVHIYVNSTIYNSLSSDIEQFKQDIIAQGYTVDVINWSINNVTKLKNSITTTYRNGLIGAILIGKLPYAKESYYDTAWYMHLTFSCDYYLMDLDGNWTDVSRNGFYDVGATDNNSEHNNGTADALPEIWAAGISPIQYLNQVLILLRH